MNYELHPLCTLFPRMSGAEFDLLRDDIKANGLRSPIVLHNGMILDGGNRYRACVDAGIDPVFMEFDGGNIVSFVLSVNMHRRHLSQGQQAAIVASAQDWAIAHPSHRAAKEGGQTSPLLTTADRAAQSGASAKTQQRADKVAKASPELARQVARGEITLPQAVEKLTGKRPGTKPLAIAPAEPAYNPADDEVAELAETVRTLSAENDALKDRIAIEAMPASEDEKTAALETICMLRKEVSRLEIENRALISSRDSYQRDNADLKRQCAMQRKQIANMEKQAA